MMRRYGYDFGWRDARNSQMPDGPVAYEAYGGWGAGRYDRPFDARPHREWGERYQPRDSYGAERRPSGRAYDARFRSGRYDRTDYDRGWGMSRLHHEIMHRQGQGSGYESNYHHRYALSPEEARRAPRRPPRRGAPYQGYRAFE